MEVFIIKPTMLVLAAAVLCLGAGIAQAQGSEEAPFQVNYFSGADGSRPDGTVRITNTGEAREPDLPGNPGNPSGDLCANIYVFRSDQQLAECCSCLVTSNALRTLSIDFDLTHNPLTATPIGEGGIKIVGSEVDTDNPSSAGGPVSASGQCLGFESGKDGAISKGAFGTFAATDYAKVSGLRAWATHNQDVSGGLSGTGVINSVTETHFELATLSESELISLQQNCAFIVSQGSGAGLCSCGRGD